MIDVMIENIFEPKGDIYEFWFIYEFLKG
jgi:hypothetical protein